MIVEQELLYQEEQGYVGLYYDRLIGYVMTVKLHQWSHSEFKRYLVIWGRILNNLKARGITEVFGYCETEDNVKFTEVFGFQPMVYRMEFDEGTTRQVMRLAL